MAAKEPSRSSLGYPTRSDWIFLAFIGVVMASTAMLGRLTYDEGVKTNLAKANAETLLAWLTAASSQRQDGTFMPTTCRRSGQSVQSGEVGTWRACREALAQAPFVLSTLGNPFSDGAVELRASCEPSDRSARGAIVIQKLVATPPGSAYPYVISPLADQDSIAGPLTLRVDICDRNGNAITSGQTDF